MRYFPFYQQLDSMDCGPTCLRMIARFYGKSYKLESLRTKSGSNREGVSLLGIAEAAESIGFRTLAVRTTIDKIAAEAVFPLIAHWNQTHFIVIYKIKGNKVYVADPGRSRLVYRREEFATLWASSWKPEQAEGVVLVLEPTDRFYSNTGDDKGLSFLMLGRYLYRQKKLLVQLALGLLTSSLLQLIFPFLTQSIVDVGINVKDLNFIYLVVFAQFMLFLGQTSVDFIRSWVLLHINTRLSLNILTDFLIKLMKLPISYFEGKMVGDIIQRMGDQQRIQAFLTGPVLTILFSFFNFFVFAFVIIRYDIRIFMIFLAGSSVYIIWVTMFLKYRRNLDFKRFDILSHDRTNIVQLVQGMQEIKMNTCETTKRWQWEKIQARLFKVNVRGLELTQYQQGGAVFINQSKNILITLFSATAVVHGELTLGSMLAIQYIIGQLNGPIEQAIQLVQVTQDAMISMERLNEIHDLEDEEPAGDYKLSEIPPIGELRLQDISFKYPGAGNEAVLKSISLVIPRGQTTAIVGASGSGKTTLLKLLMKFYKPGEGMVTIGGVNLEDISNKSWRQSCGPVLQDSYIFADTIANNIAVSDEFPDPAKLAKAVRIANIHDFIGSLPLGFNTIIGANGSGISQGQKQRILIARAAYKDPEFIFFDEATNSLDANNEKVIMENLGAFFKNKTVIVAAHRLSTVRNANNIIVMDNGSVVEQGDHRELMNRKGIYHTLVINQLETELQ